MEYLYKVMFTLEAKESNSSHKVTVVKYPIIKEKTTEKNYTIKLSSLGNRRIPKDKIGKVTNEMMSSSNIEYQVWLTTNKEVTHYVDVIKQLANESI